jgi:sulfur dioxygenase
MIFRQLLEPDTCSYTYLLSCSETGKTALIDPVLDTVERDLQVLEQLGLTLDYTIETHMHADHLTGASSLREKTGCKVAYPGVETPDCADIALNEGEIFRIGTLELHPIFAPGHTSHHFVYMLDNGTQKMLFTGDVLLIDGCGRTALRCHHRETLHPAG